MILRWVSHQRHCREEVMESVLYVGDGMNFIPSPSVDFAAGGMI